MKRSRLKNIINKQKEISKKQEVGNPFDEFKKSLPIEIDDNYRLEAAWKAYGSPKDYKTALWYGMIQPIDETNVKLPSIGYNEETDEYEYLNKGRENDTVAKDIRVWDNDVIPLVKELKQGGYIRIFNEEKDCWIYSKSKQEIDSFLKGGKSSENIDVSKTSKKDLDDFDMFLMTLPPNQRNFDPNIYNMKRYWELNGKPETFWKALNAGMFELNPGDKLYHARSVSMTPDGNYEFMKAANHNTTWMEEAWYNGQKPKLITGKEDNGNKENYTLELLLGKDKEESDLFRNEYNLIKTDSEGNPLLFWKYVKKSPQAFKQGGQMNVIPEGALHARKNGMELAKEGEITHKGVPVVDNEGNQQAEVEKEEWTITKELTEDIEKWYKDFYKEDISEKDKAELAIKCGKRVCEELLHNTDDRVGLIELIEEDM